jgi:hypothetical protein
LESHVVVDVDGNADATLTLTLTLTGCSSLAKLGEHRHDALAVHGKLRSFALTMPSLEDVENGRTFRSR